MSATKAPLDVRASVRELARKRLAKRRGGAQPNFLDAKFAAQSAFISDPARMKVALCTRRSGKSYGAGLYLCKEAWETAGVSCLYLALTRDSAKKIMWKDVLKPISRRLNLDARFNESELTATLPNESVIYILGVDSTEEEKKKLLGQKYKLVIIDEAASFSVDLNELVYGVLKPAVCRLPRHHLPHRNARQREARAILRADAEPRPEQRGHVAAPGVQRASMGHVRQPAHAATVDRGDRGVEGVQSTHRGHAALSAALHGTLGR